MYREWESKTWTPIAKIEGGSDNDAKDPILDFVGMDESDIDNQCKMPVRYHTKVKAPRVYLTQIEK